MCHDRWAPRRDEAVATRWLMDLKPRAEEADEQPARSPRERIAEQFARVTHNEPAVATGDR